MNRLLLLASLLLAATPASSQDRVANDAFVGDWYCDGGSEPLFSITGQTYSVGGQSTRIKQVERSGNDFLITLIDGYRAALVEMTEDTMIWQSLETGDSFSCSRLPGP